MHRLLHVTILASTVLGGAALGLLLLWQTLFETPMPPGTRAAAGALVLLAVALLLVEWRLVH